MDFSHLDALNIRRSHERNYIAVAKTDREIALRRVWLVQIEKEIADEEAFLGLTPGADLPEMTDDELLAALAA